MAEAPNPESVAIIAQPPSFQEQLGEEGEREEAKRLRERSLPGFTDWMHRNSSGSAAAVWPRTISMEMGTELDIWRPVRIDHLLPFISGVVQVIRGGKQTFVVFVPIRCLFDEFVPLFKHFLTDSHLHRYLKRSRAPSGTGALKQYKSSRLDATRF